MSVAMIGPKFYAWDKNGKPLAFGKLYTYQARTNNPKDTYQSEDQIVPNTNPVILNGEGYANVYLSGSYKMVLKDDDENEIWTSDPVSSAEPSEWVLCLTATYVSPTKVKVNGNFVEQYSVGRRIRIDNNASVFSYSTIVSSVFAADETTIEVRDAVITTGVQEVCASIVTPESVQDPLDQYYDSVEAMIASTTISVGQRVGRFYKTRGDHGFAEGVVKTYSQAISDGDIIDGKGNIELATGDVHIIDKKTKIKAEQYGALAESGVDDYPSLRAAFDAAANKTWVTFAAGLTHEISQELALHNGSGEGPKVDGNNSTIKATATMDNVLSVDGGTTVRNQIKDLYIDGDGKAEFCFKGVLMTEQGSLMQNIYAREATSHGFYMDGCQVMRMENIRSLSNGGWGYLFESCNGLVIDTYRSASNDGGGVKIQRGARNFTSGMQLLNSNIEINEGGAGIEVVDTASPVFINGGWVENASYIAQDGVHVSGASSGVIVKNMGIIGGDSSDNYRAIRFGPDSVGCTATDNRFQATDGAAVNWNKVEDEAPVGINDTYPNYVRSNGKIIGTEKLLTPTSAVNQAGMAGMISGAIEMSVPATGDLTFLFSPSGSFNIPGANDRGAYYVELDLIGYFTGIDQTVFKRFRIYAGTLEGSLFDGSISEEVSVGDAARAANLTATAPTIDGSTNAFEVVVSNAEGNSFDGYFTWRTVMSSTELYVTTS